MRRSPALAASGVRGRVSRLAPPLPLARVAFAVEARDHSHSPAYYPKEQRIRKTPEPGAADISVDHWKLLRRRGDLRNDVLDLRNKAISQLRIAGGIPIRRFDQLGPCGGAEDNRQHAQRRCRSSALS
jgi:hypothetical protein